MRIVAAVIIVGVMLLAPAMVLIYPYAYVAIPVCLAAGFVVLRRHSPGLALLTGALATVGIMVAAVLPFMALIALMGEYDAGENCDGFCTTNEGGFVIAVLILMVVAFPAAVIGGIVSALASVVFARSAIRA
ncbi:MAG TPA: hypothetical protein VIW01_04305 [Dehalococcoidia bacterium]